MELMPIGKDLYRVQRHGLPPHHSLLHPVECTGNKAKRVTTRVSGAQAQNVSD